LVTADLTHPFAATPKARIERDRATTRRIPAMTIELDLGRAAVDSRLRTSLTSI
jgi:hypothetical protein